MANTKNNETAPRTEELVDLFVPDDGNDPNFVTLGLNGKLYQVMKGESVKVPLGVKLVYEESLRADTEAIRRKRSQRSDK